MPNKISIVVPGWLNTDIIGVGIDRLVGKGQYARGSELKIGPGGKSRNIAEMMAVLIGGKHIAMLAKTVKDPLGLWRYPLDALNKVGVDTSNIQIEDYKQVHKFPGVALIPVDKDGNNQIYVLPGVSEDFSPTDLAKHERVFEQASQNNGILVQTLEIATNTAEAAFARANEYGLRIAFDPGGIREPSDIGSLLNHSIYLLKPNEHETEVLTGIKITNFSSAKKAAAKLRQNRVQNVLITHGKNGAYLFTPQTERHIKVPALKVNSEEHDETGCGDQTMATLCAELSKNKSIEEAAKLAILSGTLQFHRTGIQPVTQQELLTLVNK